MGKTFRDTTTTKNIWEFIKKEDGSYAVIHNGKLRSDSVPEKWRQEEFCRYGFCGDEGEKIVAELDKSGRCLIEL
jgi:hypothetical protein